MSRHYTPHKAPWILTDGSCTLGAAGSASPPPPPPPPPPPLPPSRRPGVPNAKDARRGKTLGLERRRADARSEDSSPSSASSSKKRSHAAAAATDATDASNDDTGSDVLRTGKTAASSATDDAAEPAEKRARLMDGTHCPLLILARVNDASRPPLGDGGSLVAEPATNRLGDDTGEKDATTTTTNQVDSLAPFNTSLDHWDNLLNNSGSSPFCTLGSPYALTMPSPNLFESLDGAAPALTTVQTAPVPVPVPVPVPAPAQSTATATATATAVTDRPSSSSSSSSSRPSSVPGAPPVPPTPSGGSSLPDLPNLPSRIRPIQDLRKYCQTALRRLEDAPKKHRAGAWLNEDALVRMQSLVTSAAVLEHAHLAMLRLDTHVEGFRAKCPGEGWLDELAIGCETFAQSRERRDFTFRELVLISDKLNRDKRLFYAYFELLVSGVRRRVTAEMSELVRGFIDKLGAVVDEPILRSAVVMLLERITYTTGQHLADVRMEWPRFPGTSKSCQSCGIEILVRAPAPDAARPVVTLLGEHRVPIADGTKAYCLACAVVAYVDHLATIDNVPGGGDSSNASYVQEFDAMIPAIGEAIKKYGQAYHTDDRTLRTKMGAIVEKLFAAGSSQ